MPTHAKVEDEDEDEDEKSGDQAGEAYAGSGYSSTGSGEKYSTQRTGIRVEKKKKKKISSMQAVFEELERISEMEDNDVRRTGPGRAEIAVGLGFSRGVVLGFSRRGSDSDWGGLVPWWLSVLRAGCRKEGRGGKERRGEKRKEQAEEEVEAAAATKAEAEVEAEVEK